MDITTRDGIPIFNLPGRAICKMTGENPEDMESCPCMNFDDDGELCVPELCEYYDEGRREKR